MESTSKDPLVLSCVGEGKSYLADFQVPHSGNHVDRYITTHTWME